MQQLLNKDETVRFLKSVIPEYKDLLDLLVEKNGWLPFKDEFVQSVINLKVEWWLLYGDELRFRSFITRMFMSDAEYKELADATPEERKDLDAEMVRELTEYLESDNEPVILSEEEQAKLINDYEAAEDEEKKEKLIQFVKFFMFFIASLFNYIALMVHGKSMHQLVAEAKEGNDRSFQDAVHIDRMTLYIPEFKERMLRAHLGGDSVFLGKLANQIRKPIYKSNKENRTLWLFFSILDEADYLDMPLKEMFIICQETGVYGVPDETKKRKGKTINNIDATGDENSLGKQLRKYKRERVTLNKI